MKHGTSIFNRTRSFIKLSNIIHFGYTEHRIKGGFYFLDFFGFQIIGK